MIGSAWSRRDIGRRRKAIQAQPARRHILLEQSDEWATQRARYMTLETIGAVSDTATVSLPAVAA